MNGFENFDDYRISDWMSDGLMIRFDSVKRSINTSLRSAGMVVTIAASIALSQTLAIPAGTVALTHSIPDNKVSAARSVERRVSELFRQIDEQLANLDQASDENVDPETLALAQQALAATANRGEAASNGWALRLVTGSTQA